MTALAPTRGRQRFEALDRANRVRSDRASLKRELAALSPADSASKAATLIAENASRVASMRIGELVASIARMGWDTADQMVYSCNVRHGARVSSLTAMQRAALVRRLQKHDGYVAVRKERKDAGLVPFADIPPRANGGPRCSRCGEHLRKRHPERLCGFCAEEESR